MPRTKIVSAEEAAALVPAGATVSISASSGLACPDAVLQALGERFASTGSPRQLTTIIPIAAGDMYGIGGIDHLAQPGMLKRVLAGAFPSGPSSLPSPKIRSMITNNQVEAYCLPSGILFHLHREAAAKRPGILTTVGLDTVVDPRRQGGRMNEVTTEDVVRVVEFDGREWLYFPAPSVDVAIIRGTTVDEMGNLSLEHEGTYLGVLDHALAAHNNGGIVIVQAKRLATSGSRSPQQIQVPGTLIDYVVLAPDQLQATQTLYEPALSGELRVPFSSSDLVPWGAEKVIARRAALEMARDDVVNLGFGISALVPRVLLEEGLHGSVTWAIEQGAVGGLPLLDFQFGCSANAQAIVDTPDQFTFFQGSGFDRTILSFVQADQEGNVNVSYLSARPHVTSGIGGFIDITSHARRIIFAGFLTAGGLKVALRAGALHIEREGQVRKFVSTVEQVSFSGRQARLRNQQVMFITERCVLRLESAGLIVTEIAPGVDLERDVLAQVAFPLRVSPDLRLMDARIFRPEPMGLML